jgi:hypothetical protein
MMKKSQIPILPNPKEIPNSKSQWEKGVRKKGDKIK